jgi:predicted transcriptional regulator
MVGKYFNQSYASVVSMFVEEENISIEEIRQLIQQVKNAKNEGHA